MLHHSLILRDLTLPEHPPHWPRPFRLEVGLTECLLVEGITLDQAQELVQVAATLTPPLEGEVWLWGRQTAALSRPEIFELRRRLACISPRLVLLHRLTVAENLALGPCFNQGRTAEEVLAEHAPLLERLELTEHLSSFPPALPESLAYRVLFARELMKGPELLLAVMGDPLPVPDQQRLILPLLLEWQAKKGTAILLAGRSLRTFNPLAHRLLRFHHGRFLEHRFLEHESRPLESFLPLF